MYRIYVRETPIFKDIETVRKNRYTVFLMRRFNFKKETILQK